MIDRVTSKLRHHYQVVRTTATQRVVKNFAALHGLVYFGGVSQHQDEHQLVRGVTLSSTHRDRHYCVGSIDGYDVILVQRTDNQVFPGHVSKQYTWVLMQFDVHVHVNLPHIFLNSHGYSDSFYANLSLKARHLRTITAPQLHNANQQFMKLYKAYAKQDRSYNVASVLTPQITATLAERFSQFDFEIVGDKIIVYSCNSIVTRAMLHEVTRAGLWLSKELDALGSIK